jgi:hypothetical protein
MPQACCSPEIFAFNTDVVTQQYTAAMAARFGTLPKIDVLYLVDGEYVVAGIFTQVQFDGSNIMVDNGGVQRGILRIS